MTTTRSLLSGSDAATRKDSRKERQALMFAGSEGEDLLELVHDQDERRGFRKHEVQRVEEPSRVAIQQVVEL